MGWGRGELGKAHFTGAGELLAQEGHDRAILLGRCPISVVLESRREEGLSLEGEGLLRGGEWMGGPVRDTYTLTSGQNHLQTCEHAF